MLASDIAMQHELQQKHLNELITKNLKMFSNNDLINLCDENFKVGANDLGLITSNGQKYCYLLSERGYTKLIVMMFKDLKTGCSKQLRENLELTKEQWGKSKNLIRFNENDLIDFLKPCEGLRGFAKENDLITNNN